MDSEGDRESTKKRPGFYLGSDAAIALETSQSIEKPNEDAIQETWALEFTLSTYKTVLL